MPDGIVSVNDMADTDALNPRETAEDKTVLEPVE